MLLCMLRQLSWHQSQNSQRTASHTICNLQQETTACAAAAMNVMATRMLRELLLLAESPPPGVVAWPVQDRLDELIAEIQVQHRSEHGKPFCSWIGA